MDFWTMGEADGLPAVTLCEPHALEATNIGARVWGVGPFDTMGEAAAVLEAMTAAFGQGQVTGFDFHVDQTGPCQECVWQAEQVSA